MNVRMGLIRKKPDWPFEKFDSHWRDQHGALAARAPHLRGYWQNLVVDRVQRGIEFERGGWDFDGFSQLWFDDAAQSAQAFAAGETAAALAEDESHFLGQLHIVTAEQTAVIPLPADPERASLLKRMSIIRRLTTLTEDDFRHEWRVHGDLVRKMPGVSGYRQNVVVVREREKGRPCDYETLPMDGIVEMWFQDERTLQEAFASPAGQAAMAHANTFLGDITAFLVAERRVV